MVQVTGLELAKVPVKITPFGRPSLPLPMIVKLPPGIKVAPPVRVPLLSAPVLKVRFPRSFPVISPLPPSPLTNISVEPAKLKPLLEPDKVPPLLAKSTVFADQVRVQFFGFLNTFFRI